jgi:hypothetical protein
LNDGRMIAPAALSGRRPDEHDVPLADRRISQIAAAHVARVRQFSAKDD